MTAPPIRETAFWKAAVPLCDAPLKFAPTDLKEEWVKLNERSAIKEMQASLDAVKDGNFDGFAKFDMMLNVAQSVIVPRDKLYDKFQDLIFTHLRQGRLLAFGFEPPRTVSAVPIEIPSSHWSGHIRWGKSELTHESLHFIEVRVLPRKTVLKISDKLLSEELAPLTSDKRKQGRPTIRPEITSAYFSLVEDRAIEPGMRIKVAVDYVRQRLSTKFPELEVTDEKPSNEAIRRIISPLMKSGNKQ